MQTFFKVNVIYVNLLISYDSWGRFIPTPSPLGSNLNKLIGKCIGSKLVFAHKVTKRMLDGDSKSQGKWQRIARTDDARLKVIENVAPAFLKHP